MYRDYDNATKHLVDVVSEHKRLRTLQYNAEWEGDNIKSEFYKSQANYYKELVREGILYDPEF